MISAIVACAPGPGAPSLEADLESVGIQVAARTELGNLVQDTVRHAPDVVLVFDPFPDHALFAGASALATTCAVPVVVFTTDPDAEKIEQAMQSGIHAYVINGYAAQRLRPVIQVALARFRHERSLRVELSELNHRFDERKLVDRAKGILMRARQISEEDAFRLLRTTAMHGKQRVGQVARQVIDSARYAEAVNRAGQLRMLSQRLVKLYALRCTGHVSADAEGWFRLSFERAEENLANLQRNLSKPTFGDLVDAVLAAWARLKDPLQKPPELDRLAAVDRLAEDLLRHAETLTSNLESARLAPTLRAINVSGRQRMLAQRLAKQALMNALLPPTDPRSATREFQAAQKSFVEAMSFLHALPLMTHEIRSELAAGTEAWDRLRAALEACGTAEGRVEMTRLSETLLDHFDRLTDHYERSMQTLMG